MEFTLNEYHRDISDEELLGDLLRVANLLKTNRLSRAEYKQYGKYGTSTIERRFGGWNNAISKIGLTTNIVWQQRHESLEKEEDFFFDLKHVAEWLGKDHITTGDYLQYGKYDRGAMLRKYGSWDVLLKLAGLKPTPFRLGKNKGISDEELFQDIERVWMKLGRQPTITDVKNGEFKFGQNTFVRRFGGWRGALEAFVKYINSEEDISSFEESVPVATQPIEETHPDIDKQTYKPQTHTSHSTRRDINLRLRFKVMQRDGFKCCICGKSPATTPGLVLHIDHIKPWSKGGETTLDNLQTLCSDCNLGKSDLMIE